MCVFHLELGPDLDTQQLDLDGGVGPWPCWSVAVMLRMWRTMSRLPMYYTRFTNILGWEMLYVDNISLPVI